MAGTRKRRHLEFSHGQVVKPPNVHLTKEPNEESPASKTKRNTNQDHPSISYLLRTVDSNPFDHYPTNSITKTLHDNPNTTTHSTIKYGIPIITILIPLCFCVYRLFKNKLQDRIPKSEAEEVENMKIKIDLAMDTMAANVTNQLANAEFHIVKFASTIFEETKDFVYDDLDKNIPDKQITINLKNDFDHNKGELLDDIRSIFENAEKSILNDVKNNLSGLGMTENAIRKGSIRSGQYEYEVLENGEYVIISVHQKMTVGQDSLLLDIERKIEEMNDKSLKKIEEQAPTLEIGMLHQLKNRMKTNASIIMKEVAIKIGNAERHIIEVMKTQIDETILKGKEEESDDDDSSEILVEISGGKRNKGGKKAPFPKPPRKKQEQTNSSDNSKFIVNVLSQNHSEPIDIPSPKHHNLEEGEGRHPKIDSFESDDLVRQESSTSGSNKPSTPSLSFDEDREGNTTQVWWHKIRNAVPYLPNNLNITRKISRTVKNLMRIKKKANEDPESGEELIVLKIAVDDGKDQSQNEGSNVSDESVPKPRNETEKSVEEIVVEQTQLEEVEIVEEKCSKCKIETLQQHKCSESRMWIHPPPEDEEIVEDWPSHLPKNTYGLNDVPLQIEERKESIVSEISETSVLTNSSSNISYNSSLKDTESSDTLPELKLPNMDRKLLKKRRMQNRRQMKSLDSGVHHYYGQYIAIEFPAEDEDEQQKTSKEEKSMMISEEGNVTTDEYSEAKINDDLLVEINNFKDERGIVNMKIKTITEREDILEVKNDKIIVEEVRTMTKETDIITVEAQENIDTEEDILIIREEKTTVTTKTVTDFDQLEEINNEIINESCQPNENLILINESLTSGNNLAEISLKNEELIEEKITIENVEKLIDYTKNESDA